MNFCTKCGNPLNPNARFCGSCGTTINMSGSNAVANPVSDPWPTKAETSSQMSNLNFSMKNSQRRVVNIWLILLAVFVFFVFVPSIIGLDGFEGGFFMSFMAGFLAIMSLIVIFIYRSRAKQLDKILKGEGRVAVWQYAADEWLRFIAADFEEEKKSKKMLFFVVAIISIVVGILLMISLENTLVLFIALGIIPIVAIPAFIAPRYRYNKLKNSEAKALIAEKGVIVGKMFHLWIGLGARLDSVILNSEESPAMIEFTYSMPTRNGRNTQVARVPVPRGKYEDARRIAYSFSNQQQ